MAKKTKSLSRTKRGGYRSKSLSRPCTNKTCKAHTRILSSRANSRKSRRVSNRVFGWKLF